MSEDKIKFSSSKREYGLFSNFSPHPILLDNKLWPTSEHYYQAQKFIDESLQELIRNATSPGIAAQLGRNKHLPLRNDWDKIKYDVMLRALHAKVSQHNDVRELLLSTGDKEIIEYAPWGDIYWGDGGDGSGQNNLGKAWMNIREELRISKSEKRRLEIQKGE